MLTCITEERLRGVLANRGGVIASGLHEGTDNPECPVCLVEAVRLVCDRPWGDVDPDFPDLRAINDAITDDALRTELGIALAVAFRDWSDDPQRQQRWLDRVCLYLTNEVVAELPQIPDSYRAECRKARTVAECRTAAARAAEAAGAAGAAWAAWAAGAAEAAWAAEAAGAARAAGAAWAAWAAGAVEAAGAARAAWAAWAAGAAWAAERDRVVSLITRRYIQLWEETAHAAERA